MAKADNFFYRVVDANFNRAREGLRVCEDISRFIIKSKTLTSGIRKIRQRLSGLFVKTQKKRFLAARNSPSDIGKGLTKVKTKRRNYADVFMANMERSKESVRVLEEFFKLNDERASKVLMSLRYKLYNLEKKGVEKIRAVCGDRQRAVRK